MSFRWPLKKFLADTIYYIFGGVLFSLGLYTFGLNADFAPGGVAGVARILHVYTQLPIGTLSLLVNIPIIAVCMRVVGFGFLIKSFWAMAIQTILLDLVFPLFPVYKGDALLASMFCGVLVGAGCAILYMRDSSTGGSDFIIMTVKKIRPHFSVGQISLAFDAAVILASGFVFSNVDSILYGIICAFATTMAMDNIMYGAGSGKLAIIITNHGQEIAHAIDVEVERGSTLVKATGTYTGESRDMLYCACSKSEVYKVRTAAHAVDPDSLVMITEASEVFGEGFVAPAGQDSPPPGGENTAN